MKPSRDISRLLEIMAALRDRKTGCPWDIEQDFASIAPYRIEDSYEVADAIERGDMAALTDRVEAFGGAITTANRAGGTTLTMAVPVGPELMVHA